MEVGGKTEGRGDGEKRRRGEKDKGQTTEGKWARGTWNSLLGDGQRAKPAKLAQPAKPAKHAGWIHFSQAKWIHTMRNVLTRCRRLFLSSSGLQLARYCLS